MFKSNAFGENQAEAGIQCVGGESKMRTTEANTATVGNHQSTPPLTREQEIEEIVKSEYRRHRLGDKEVVLFSPSTLTKIADGGFQALRQDPHVELKIDVTAALRMFSPAERRILSRVFIQGQAVDLATKGSRKSSSYWHYWLQHTALPKLRNALKDYNENGKVVLA